MRIVLSDRVVLPCLEPSEARFEIAPAVLHLERETISSVERGAEAVAAIRQRADRVACDDFGDQLVGPAYVDPHTHLALGFLRAFPSRASMTNLVEDLFFRVERNIEPGDVRAFVRLGAYECLLAGTGLVFDHYYFAESVAEGLRDVGLCGVVAPTLQDLGGPFASRWEAELESTYRIAAASHPGIYAAVGPHATDTVSEDLMLRASRAAGELDTVLHLHVAQTEEELMRVKERTGHTPLTWLMGSGALDAPRHTLLVHGLFIHDAELAELEPTKNTLVVCPNSQAKFGFVAPVDRWTDHGKRWCVGTDCAASNDSLNVVKELALLSGLPSASINAHPAYRAYLRTGTRATAIATGRARRAAAGESLTRRSVDALLEGVWSIPGSIHPGVRAGVLAPGAIANIVAWDLDAPEMWPAESPLAALVFASSSAAITAMYVRGRPVGKRGDFRRSITRTVEYRDAVREATERRTRLLARSGLST